MSAKLPRTLCGVTAVTAALAAALLLAIPAV